MSISYFTIGLKIWCPTNVKVHLFCRHPLYFFVFLTELAQQNPWRFTVVNSTLWERRHDVLCLILQQIWNKKKYTRNFTPVELKCINIKAYAKPSWNSYQPIPAEQQLNKFLPATMEIWDFLPVMLFHKGITQAGSKMSGQHPHQSVKLVPCSSEILIK